MRLTTLLSFTFLVGTLSACTTIPIADDPWCADAGANGARCTTTLSGQHFSLNKYQWDKLRTGQICTATQQPGLGYKNIKAPLEKLCADSSFCTPDQKADLTGISQEVDGILDSASGSPTFSGDPANSAQPSLNELGLRPEK